MTHDLCFRAPMGCFQCMPYKDSSRNFSATDTFLLLFALPRVAQPKPTFNAFREYQKAEGYKSRPRYATFHRCAGSLTVVPAFVVGPGLPTRRFHAASGSRERHSRKSLRKPRAGSLGKPPLERLEWHRFRDDCEYNDFEFSVHSRMKLSPCRSQVTETSSMPLSCSSYSAKSSDSLWKL